jgi:hypothetical protein
MKEVATGQWISLDSEMYDSDTVELSEGVEFHIFVSPYDLPEAVRGRRDAAKRRFVVEFKYIGDEPSEERRVNEHVTFFIGKHSHRVHRIEADVDGLGTELVTLRLVPAIDALAKELHSVSTPADNFRVAKAVLTDRKAELTRELVGA